MSILEFNDKLIYHGSNVIVKVPNLEMAQSKKDFGIGFYTTTSQNQAIKFARLVSKRNSYYRAPVVSKYVISTLQGLKVKYFETANLEWLEYILMHRNSRGPVLPVYDVVIGPVADDDVASIIRGFDAGFFGDPCSEETKKKVLIEMHTERLSNQIVFCSKISLQRISYGGFIHVI